MDLSFKKIKLISKEKKRDVLYMTVTLIIVILITGIFIFSLNIVLRAIDATFVIGGEDVSSEILSFDLDNFAKVASRLGISFNLSETPKENISVIIPSSQSTSTQESVSTSTEAVSTTTPI